LDQDTKAGFLSIDSQIGSIFSNSSTGLGDTLAAIQISLQSGQLSLEERAQNTATAIEVLSQTVETEYKHLSKELKGLANVESVLLDTGDSVLDTKRRLEYGVQQIMGEINHQLSTYTGNLNTSIQNRFDTLATAVLGNQSLALTNLTSRMEEEISQVWRQIGILYHQMSKSANLLDEIHSQTSQYVNNSMDTMSSMDGKVGQITSQMAGVDDNLNYLLGRMSLVVQEFNMIKGGLGDALVSLKESFAEIGELEGTKEPQGDEGVITRMGGDSSENNVL
jgi:DNA anti-recombination protein RmuC